MLGTDLNFSYSGRHPMVLLGSGNPCKTASSLDPTLLGIFQVVSFQVQLQTLLLLNFHLSRNRRRREIIRKKYQENNPTNNQKRKTSPGSLRVLTVWLTVWGLATPSYWPCVDHGSECAHALGLVWNSSPSVHPGNPSSLPCTVAQRSPLL